MVFFMIVMSIGMFVHFLQALVLGWIMTISAIFCAIVCGYFLMCVYSLYITIKNEIQAPYYSYYSWSIRESDLQNVT